MTGTIKLFGMIEALRYIERVGVPGAIVESGVWRGGSMQAAALTLLGCGTTERELISSTRSRACRRRPTRTCA